MNEHTAEFIKNARVELGLTQAQLAKKLGKGRSTIARYECSMIIPPGDIVLEIQQLLSDNEKDVA